MTTAQASHSSPSASSAALDARAWSDAADVANVADHADHGDGVAMAAAATAPAANPALKIERESHKLEKRLCRQVGQAIVDYNMIEAGDKVMVCVSGGKVLSTPL